MVEEKKSEVKKHSENISRRDLTEMPAIYMMMLNKQSRLIGGAIMHIRYYPRCDKRGRAIVDVYAKINDMSFNKTFISTCKMKNQPFCKMTNKKGVSLDIPLELLENIYKFVMKLENKVEEKVSVKPLFQRCVTVEDFVNQHFKQMYLKKNPENKSVLNKTLEYWKAFHIDNIHSNMIYEYIDKMFDLGAAGGTIKKRCQLLKQIFKLSIELDYRIKNPFDNVKMPNDKPEEKTEPIPSELLPEIFEKLKNTDKALYQYCALIYFAGMRPGDIRRLTPAHVKVIDGFKCFYILENKNKKKVTRSEHKIPIHPALEEIIDFDTKDKYLIKYISESKFSSNYGKECNRLDMARIMWKHFKKKITEDYTPYQFKHTFASELANNKIPEMCINYLLGKTAIKGTLDNYVSLKTSVLYNAILSLSFPTIFRPIENIVNDGCVKISVNA